MSATKNEIISYLLTPLAWAFGAVTEVRNKLFDWRLLPSEEFDIPVVGIGNITVGGTGKTPMVEYIARMLGTEYKIAVLSRGYMRHTKGFILANSNSTPDTIGDEPYQIYRKYGPRVKVAVCENRRKGIKELQKIFPDLQLIVLDDSFQHRYVRPKVSVVLMDYNRPPYKDMLLPLGHLREGLYSLTRAEMVVVTKCPPDMPPINFRIVKKELGLMANQGLYFSTVDYGRPEPVFPEDDPYEVSLGAMESKDSALLLTGVANPRGFIRYFKNYDFRCRVAHFSDHHNFSRSDVEKIASTFKKMKGRRKVILTTEKDAARLSNNPYFPQELKPYTFYIPITTRMLPGLSGDTFIADLEKELFSTGKDVLNS